MSGTQPVLRSLVHKPQGTEIVDTENGVGIKTGLGHAPESFRTRLQSHAGGCIVPPGNSHAICLKPAAERLARLSERTEIKHVRRRIHIGGSPRTGLLEMFRHQPAALFQIIDDTGTAIEIRHAVQSDIRDSCLVQQLECGKILFARTDQDTARLHPDQTFRKSELAFFLPVAAAGKESQPHFIECALRMFHHHGMKRIGEVGHDEPDNIRLSGAELARRLVRDVIQLFGDLENTPPCSPADLRASFESQRNGHIRNSCHFRYIVDCTSHRSPLV